MTSGDKDKMISLGYNLIKGNPKNNIWVFSNKEYLTFDADDEITNAGISFVLSDVITF
jgi:hypothetical protein